MAGEKMKIDSTILAVYLCKYCREFMLSCSDEKALDEGVPCRSCGMTLTADDCEEVGFSIDGELYLYRGDGTIHASEMSHMERELFCQDAWTVF
jgi:hypothetical protein